KTTSCAPAPAASAASPASLPSVASRSSTTGSAWTQATLTRSRIAESLVAASMADWVTISSLATAGGTLVLAGATFASVRSANRAARAAETSLLASMRPLLLPSRPDDPPQKVGFADEHWLHVKGGTGAAEATDSTIYLAIALRNVGTGIAVLHGWRFWPEPRLGNQADHAPRA